MDRFSGSRNHDLRAKASSPVKFKVMAIDPGEVHCGTAIFDVRDPEGARPTVVNELEPRKLFMAIEQGHPRIKLIVIESFRLYPGVDQRWSGLKTVEVIGVVRYLCDRFEIPLFEQNATIKKPTFKIMAARGIELRSKSEKKGQHCMDAEAHGWHYLNKPKVKL